MIVGLKNLVYVLHTHVLIWLVLQANDGGTPCVHMRSGADQVLIYD